MQINGKEVNQSEDCISREALYKALYEHFHEEDAPNNITNVRLGAVRNFVKNFPIVTPAPKKGKWIDTDVTILNRQGYLVHEVICSECNGISYFRKMGNKYIGANLCPNCGAEMESEE